MACGEPFRFSGFTFQLFSIPRFANIFGGVQNWGSAAATKLFFRMQRQLLHALVQQLTNVNFIFRRTIDFVNPAKLF
jgi:hypothetical protein